MAEDATMTLENTLSGGDKPPCCYWKNTAGQAGYKLVKLADSGLIYHDLANAARFVGFDDLLGQNNVALYANASTDRHNFLDAYQAQLARLDPAVPWLATRTGSWGEASLQASPHAAGHSDWQAFVNAVVGLGAKEGTSDKLHAFKEWLTNAKAIKPERAVLFIRDLSLNAADKKNAVQILMTLRQLYDDKSNQAERLQTVLLDSDDAFYRELPDFSSYTPLCQQYCLPRLNLGEVQSYAAHRHYGLLLSDDAADKILEHTGGQLYLLQECLRRLRREAGADAKIDLDANNQTIELTPSVAHVERVARKMRGDPPQLAEHWKQRLRQILTETPDLLQAMRAYASGDTLGKWRFPPEAQERPLFVSGWVGVNPYGRWGISSTLHAELARTVLDGFRKG